MSALTTTAPGRDIIFYDGHCRFCVGSAKQLERLLGGSRVELRSFREEGALAAFPGISLERCEKAMQYVRADGRVFEGAEAVVQALAHRPWGVVLKVYYVPGLRQLADSLYRLVARYRFRIAGRTCSEGTCALHFK